MGFHGTSSFGTVEHFIEMYSDSEVTFDSFSQEATDSIIDGSLSKNELLNKLKEKLASSEGSTTGYININGRRIKRKWLLVKYIKELADYKCQACGFMLIKKNEKRYVEAAHIDPLALSKLDTIENMVALCPNCHKKLDHGNEAAREEVLKALGKI